MYAHLKNFRDGIVSTDSLGKAFEPEQRFENPDGSDILFNEDYFGAHRGVSSFPGPIELQDPKDNEKDGILRLSVFRNCLTDCS